MWPSTLVERLSDVSPVLLTVLLDIAVKGLAILLLTAFTIFALRRASAAARHLVWFLGTLSLLILPMLSIALPGWYILPRWAMNDPAPAANPRAEVSSLPLAQTSASSVESYSGRGQGEGKINEEVRTMNDELLRPEYRARGNDAPSAPQGNPTLSRLHLPWQTWTLFTWLAGSVLLLCYIILGLISLRRLERQSSRITDGSWPILLRDLAAQLGIRRPVRLLSSPRRTMPMTWGLWHTRLLLPDDSTSWTLDQRRAVLLHELAHARRWDCLTQIITQFTCALNWFNPLVWLAWRQMQTERERACDDLVLSTGTKASAYAEQLLRIASQMPAMRFSAAAIAMARPSKLEGRLLAILDVKRNRKSLTWSAGLLVVVLIGAFTVPLAMVRAEDEQKEKKPSTSPAATQAADADPREAAAHFIHLLQTGQIEEVLQLYPASERTAEVRERMRRTAAGTNERARVVDGRQLNDDVAVVILEVPQSNDKSGVKYITRPMTRREGKWTMVLKTDSIAPDDPVFQPLMPWIEERLRELQPAATQPATDDRQAIQGIWELVSASQGGKPIPAEAMQQMKFVIDEKEIRTMQGDQVIARATYTLDPTRQPKWLDLQPEHYPQDNSPPGIYELNGDILRMCSGKTRPSEFASQDGSLDSILLLMRCAKPATTPPVATQATTQPARTATFNVTLQLAGNADRQWKQLVKGDGWQRIEEPDGKVLILNAIEGKQMFLNPESKTATISTLVNVRPEVAMMPVAKIEKSAEPGTNPVVLQGKQQIAGREADGIRFTVGGGMVTRTVWRDTATGRLVRIETDVDHLPAPAKPFHSAMSDIVFDVPLDDSLFAIQPPAGYEIRQGVGVEFQTIKLPTTDAATQSAATQPVAALNADQRLVLDWTDRQFGSYFDAREFAGWSDQERETLEARCIDALKGPHDRAYYQSIGTLAALKSTKALAGLRQIAFDRADKNNRDRWMAVRALGLIGDRQSIPDLIHLVYHGNLNTHWWAQITLVRLTGQNFGKDWQAWGKWWNDSAGQPAFDPKIIRWWTGQAELDKLAQTLEEADSKFLDGLKTRENPATQPAATQPTPHTLSQ